MGNPPPNHLSTPLSALPIDISGTQLMFSLSPQRRVPLTIQIFLLEDPLAVIIPTDSSHVSDPRSLPPIPKCSLCSEMFAALPHPSLRATEHHFGRIHDQETSHCNRKICSVLQGSRGGYARLSRELVVPIVLLSLWERAWHDTSMSV